MLINSIQVIEVINIVLDEAESHGLLQTYESDSTAPLPVYETAEKSYRDHVIHELLETERKYVQDLKSLNELKDTLQQRGILPRDVIHGIFLNIGAILGLQQRFLIALEETFDKPKAMQNWGLPFVEFEKVFVVYQPFLANKRRAVEIAKKEFEKIATVKHTFALNSDILETVLHRPISRLMMYHLMLKVRVLRNPVFVLTESLQMT